MAGKTDRRRCCWERYYGNPCDCEEKWPNMVWYEKKWRELACDNPLMRRFVGEIADSFYSYMRVCKEQDRLMLESLAGEFAAKLAPYGVDRNSFLKCCGVESCDVDMEDP